MKEVLNKAQYEAVTTTEGPVLVIAGPGSGKTKTLVERAVYLLSEKNVKPENILISTFTEKAANELISRISEKLREKKLSLNLNNMYIGTLHSIFRRLIEENIEYSMHVDGFKVLDDTEQLFFVFSKIRFFKELQGADSFFKAIPCRNNWEKSKKILYWLSILNEHGKNLEDTKTDSPIITFLKNAQILYKKFLKESNVIDFSTIQAELLEMLLKYAEVREELNEKIKYIMIDEYQDTNNVQEKIIFLLGDKYRNICVVGDDDQAIYRFRGATVKNIHNFPKRFEKGQCKLITLNINYRSQLDIVRLCNRWISLINWDKYRYPKEMISPDNKPFSPTASVIRIGGDSESKWKENIFKFIKTLHSTGKISDYNQVAFLFNSVQNQGVKDLKNYLTDMGIPVYSPRSKDFFERDEVRIVLASLLVYFPQTKYLVLDNIKNRTNEIFYYYKYSLEVLKRYLKDDEEFHKWLIEKRKQNIDKNIEYYPNLKSIFYSFLQFKTFKNFIKLDDISELEKRETHNLAIFTDILDKYEILTKIEKIPAQDLDTYLRYFFMVYLRQLKEKKVDEYENKENFPSGAVPFLTFHQSKGLEFPIVIVGSLYAEPRSFPLTYEDSLKEILKVDDKYEPLERKAIFDFWRLYYTAFSRAQDLLVLTSVEVNNYKRRTPSKIFSPLFYWAPAWTDSEKFELKHLNVSPMKDTKNKKFLSYTSNITLYDFCPLKYQFTKEFKFITNKNHESAYGIFFHKSLEEINRYILKYKSAPEDEDIKEIIEKVNSFMIITNQVSFEESSKNSVFNDIKKYLQMSIPEDVMASEYKVFSVQDDYILEGILDLIRKNGNDLEVIDFKSGRYDEENFELYKKQLSIYTYLLKQEYPDKEIKSFLYYGREENPFINTKIQQEDIDKEINSFTKTAESLLNKKFPPRKYDDKCLKCDFRWYCKENKGDA